MKCPPGKSGTFLVLGSDHKKPIDHCNFVLLFCLQCAEKYGQKTVNQVIRALMVASTIHGCSHLKLNSNRKGAINTTIATSIPPNSFLTEHLLPLYSLNLFMCSSFLSWISCSSCKDYNYRCNGLLHSCIYLNHEWYMTNHQ